LITIIQIAVPTITFLLLAVVGSSLTPADFTRLWRARATVVSGLIAPLILLPPLALALVALFRPARDIEAGLLLIAACPIGGISNTYSYLARASTALSVTLTAASCLLAVITIPLLDRTFELVLQRPFGFRAPLGLLLLQMLLMLALPVGLGMWARQRWPDWTHAHSRLLQQTAFLAMAVLLALFIAGEAERFLGGLRHTVPLAATFVVLSLIAGWLVGMLLAVSRADQFTLATEFATRNVAVATAIAVTLLGRSEFALFASTYFLTELPIMLVAIGVFRRRAGNGGDGGHGTGVNSETQRHGVPLVRS
jgi:BASS family bile acid:Na+ symporter